MKRSRVDVPERLSGARSEGRHARGTFRKLSGIMPCRIGVNVARMNGGLMGRMLGSFVGGIMGHLSRGEHRFLAGVTG